MPATTGLGWLAERLTGDPDSGARLLSQAVDRAATDVADPDREVVRAWVVRGFLARDGQVGAQAADDVDDPGSARLAVRGHDTLAAALRQVSKLAHAVLLLRYCEDLDDADIARAVGSTEAGIAIYRNGVLARIQIDMVGEDELRERLRCMAPDPARPGSVRPSPEELAELFAKLRHTSAQLPVEPAPRPGSAGSRVLILGLLVIVLTMAAVVAAIW